METGKIRVEGKSASIQRNIVSVYQNKAISNNSIVVVDLAKRCLDVDVFGKTFMK
jgi:hypothetical protein